MQTTSSELNALLLDEIEKEAEFASNISDAFVLAQELIGRLLIGLARARSGSTAAFGKAEMEALVEGLENDYPFMPEDQLDFMANAVFHCFYAEVGLETDREEDGVSCSDDEISLNIASDLIFEHGLDRGEYKRRMDAMINAAKTRQ